MSAATATATEDATAAKPAKGKKKLIIIIAAVLVLVLGGGGAAAVLMMKKSAAAAAAAEEADGEDGESKPAKAAAHRDPKVIPTFVPLDSFTVNLADQQADRFAQVGMTLEISDAKFADQIKTFMPAIRNNVLMAIADRTASELMGREGKTQLAERIRREVSRALGVDVGEEPAHAEEGAAEGSAAKPKKKKHVAPELPVTAVHFSNFIIQ
jgi:flagellar FliL protein